jgi:hypothetical protein
LARKRSLWQRSFVSTAESTESPSWLYRIGQVASAAIPFVIAALRTSSTPQWRDDGTMVHAMDIMVAPGKGAVSTLLMQLMVVFPIGNLHFRHAMLSACSLGVVGYLLFVWVHRLLKRDSSFPILTPFLALTASLTATLAPTLHNEATVGGGSLVAVGLMLSTLLSSEHTTEQEHQPWYWLGTGLCLCFAESIAAGILLTLVLLVQFLLYGTKPRKAPMILFAVGVGMVALPLVGATILRPMSGHLWLEAGRQLSWTHLVPVDVASLRIRGISSWLQTIGIIAFSFAALGLVLAIVKRECRALGSALLLFVLADLIAPVTNAGVLTPSFLAPWRVVAVCGVSASAALGVQYLCRSLLRSRLPFAKQATVMLVVFHLSLGAVASEQSAFESNHSKFLGAQSWTDEALDTLPPNSLVLVRSSAIALRLWSARTVYGQRPDIVIVPLPMLSQGNVAASLLYQEKALTALMRDLSAQGAPGEFALSAVADIHPFYLELDPAWDVSLSRHTMPNHLWLRYASEPLGHSDRKLGLQEDTPSWNRIVNASKKIEFTDVATLQILSEHARQQVISAALSGDRQAATLGLERIEKLATDQVFVDEMRAILDRKQRGSIDLRRALR